jgi:hypothetical protein
MCCNTRRRVTTCASLLLFLLVLLATPGCGSDRAAMAPSQSALLVDSGDHQAGAINEPLGKAIAVRVLDDAGDPVGGATVQWSANSGGAVVPEQTTTDSAGDTHATWTLGPVAGLQHAVAASDGYSPVTFSATAHPKTSTNDGPIVVLHLTTPERSGQTVHPDYVATPAQWKGARHYLAITPYPNGDRKYENPSLLGGSVTDGWSPPPGLQNPIALPKAGYLSDPDIVYLPAHNAVRVYYRAVNAGDVIRMIESGDGVHFSAPVTVLQGNANTIVSPAVVRLSATDWLMWSVNATSIGCAGPSTSVELRRSKDDIAWSAPTTVDLVQPGFSPWHIDVQWIPSQHAYWAVFNVKTAGSCTTPALYFASSADGVSWVTYPSPVLARGAIPEFSDIIYRSTFAYDSTAGVIDFWYSGAHYGADRYVWHSAYQRRFRANVFADISQTKTSSLARRALRPGVPPLLDPP